MSLLESPVSMLMSTDDLVVADPKDTLMRVWELMVEESIEHVPLVQGDTLVGLLSSWDLAEFAVARGSDAMKQVRAEELMERDLVSILPRESLRKAAEMLAERGFHALPVVDEDRTLLGILTSSDVIAHVAKRRA
jgi:acetoin utilization protein AcuB